MKKNILIQIAFSIISVFILSSCAQKEPIKQNWKGTVTESNSTCKNIGKDILGDYDFVVEFGEKDTILLTVVLSGNIFKGLRSESDTSLYHFTGNFQEDAGILSEIMEIRITEPGVGIGKSKWSWSDGLMSCKGDFVFTLKKIE